MECGQRTTTLGWRWEQARQWVRRPAWLKIAGVSTLGFLCWAGLDLSEASEGIRLDEARQFWSFRPLQKCDLPSVTKGAWPRQRLDYFILAAQEAQGLEPSSEADQPVLLRRVYFTLTGLPPAPEDVAAFVGDRSEPAYERVVERLLDSPSFGERLASVWLNLARYAEDQAHQVGDDRQQFYPNAHLYRSWVIRAFNNDLPYDQFVRMQLAADFYASGETNELPALGFLGLGPKYYNRGRLEVMADEWEDRVDTVCRTFLGLTVACARCHDHKYDPISMEDYYGLAGVFASTRMHNRPFAPQTETEPPKEESGAGKGKKKDKGPDPRQTMHIVEDGEVKSLNVFLRGNVESPGPEVPRRFLRVLCGSEPVPFAEGSGRRELAEAIVSADNPLTARVMVNRLWDMVFGRGLVGTPSNFGAIGEPPTHPALLDDLARRLVEGGWRIKPLLREMVLSATFRQRSEGDQVREEKDAGNRYWWRMSKQRLSVEMWRDAMLAASGMLRWEEGPSLELDHSKNLRRTVYSRVSRLQLNDFLMQYDYPDANVHSARRILTTTPTQKLVAMNHPMVLAQAEALVGRLESEAGAGDRERIERAYLLLYGRQVGGPELRWGLEYLKEHGADRAAGWVSYAQALMVANEMYFLD